MVAKDYKIIKGHNFRVLEVNGFGKTIFGCPPGIVKEFANKRNELPNRYVIPIRTFVKGRNHFDFEFIVYSFLFVKPKNEKIIIYCTEDQRERFNVIMNETLFGPKFHQILRSQFRSLAVKNEFTAKKTERMNRFLDELTVDKVLRDYFDSLLKSQKSDRVIQSSIKGYFSDLLKKNRWLVGKNGSDLSSDFAKNYILCAQLKNEMDLFALSREEDREAFTEKIIEFNIFDENGVIYIHGEKDKRKKLKIVQTQPSKFDVYERNQLKCQVDISKLDRHRKPVQVQPIKKPFMGATFMGVGSGFAPQRKNSCMIAWTEGKGIMVDALHDSAIETIGYGITQNDVEYVFLTHVHSDHDIGLIEKILYGERVKVISSRIIFDSFLRKVEALTCFPLEMIESFLDFLEVEPNKKIKLPGFKNSYFTFDYSLHSIPAGRFVLTYKENGHNKSISHSGDTKYDLVKLQSWYEQGLLTKNRRDSLLGFIWDADLIIHEVGGGILHTELEALSKMPQSILKKVRLVHQHSDPPTNQKKFQFAKEGQTISILSEGHHSKVSQIETLKQVPLFNGVSEKGLMDMLSHSGVERFDPDEMVFSQNEIGDSFYVILDGFAEVIIDEVSQAIYEKGKFFGELAISTNDPRRRATVKALSNLTVLKIPKRFYKKLELPKIQDDFYKLNNYYNDIISPSLIAFLAFGKMVHWSKNEKIIKKGARDRCMYIVLSGQVRVENENKVLAILKVGDVLGEIALVKNIPRTATVVAQTEEVHALALGVDEAYKVFKLFPSFYGTIYQKVKKLEAIMV